MVKKIYPSLISADLLNLVSVIKQLEPECDGFHIDVMDFHFVPNLTWGPSFINAIAQATKKQLWVHLMIENNEAFLDKLQLRANDMVSFHIESVKSAKNFINDLQKKKLIPSVAVKPKTDLNKLFEVINGLPHVLLMSVEPGFSGQQFLESSVDRLTQLNDYRKKQNLQFRIGIDGGITKKNIASLAQLGADDFAIASAIFDKPDIVAAILNLKESIEGN